MASVQGPVIPTRPASPTYRPPVPKHAPQPRSHASSSDPYYGHEALANIAAHFVAHLFTCPEQQQLPPPPPLPTSSAPQIRLEYFIAYALHRTRLHESVTFAALYLLQRLKARFPAAKGSSGHRLFISAFMLASKIICDDTYSNKSWCIVAQGMFALREVNQMEREMCSYLEWQLNVEPKVLSEFEARVRRDFVGAGPYPPLVIPQESSAGSGSPAHVPFAPTTHTSATSRPTYAIPSPPSSPRSGKSREDEDDVAPCTPEASHSNTPSPASTASPPTPPDVVPGYSVDIAGEPRHIHRPSRSSHKSRRHNQTVDPALESQRPREVPADPYAAAVERADIIIASRGTRKRVVSPTGRSKLQVGRDMYAYATRTVW